MVINPSRPSGGGGMREVPTVSFSFNWVSRYDWRYTAETNSDGEITLSYWSDDFGGEIAKAPNISGNTITFTEFFTGYIVCSIKPTERFEGAVYTEQVFVDPFG